MTTPTFTGAYTCTHHNDQQRSECPVCLVTTLTAERDYWQKIAVSASHEREHNANVAQAMTAERDQLRAEVKSCGELSCDECNARTAAITAERDQLRADRTYNHECINRLAVATGTLGEKSEKVVDVVLSTIDQLRARAERAEAELAKYLSACPASPTEEERKRCQQWWAISGRSP